MKSGSMSNRAATALRMAATALWRSKTCLGAKFKRLRAQLGAQSDHRPSTPPGPAWFTGCSATDMSAWTKEWNSTSSAINTSRLNGSRRRPRT